MEVAKRTVAVYPEPANEGRQTQAVKRPAGKAVNANTIDELKSRRDLVGKSARLQIQ